MKQIKIMYSNFMVTELCYLFEVSSSNFHYGTKRSAVENKILRGEINRIFNTSGQIYSKRRIQSELKDLGHQLALVKYRVL